VGIPTFTRVFEEGRVTGGQLGESSEVPVSREERNSAVDAALGNQRVAETCLAALRQHLRSQLSRSLQ